MCVVEVQKEFSKFLRCVLLHWPWDTAFPILARNWRRNCQNTKVLHEVINVRRFLRKMKLQQALKPLEIHIYFYKKKLIVQNHTNVTICLLKYTGLLGKRTF